MGLLDYLTATSMDEDYAHVSRRRADDGGPASKGRPGRVALVVLAVFGVLVATAALQTSRTADESASSRASLVKQADSGRAVLGSRRAKVGDLRRQIADLQADDLRETAQGRALRSRITRLGVQAGTVPTRGPGIEVRLDDAPNAKTYEQRVQAPDLQKLVNALWQSGAEAVSVDGQRLTSLSAIREAAGSITVNFASLSRPYTVQAIGDPKTMGARLLDTSGGQTWVTLQSFGLQFDVDTKDSMLLPAAKRATLRSAHLPEGSR
jgi:uncharacterized protein YlxW (UPF0749 family)